MARDFRWKAQTGPSVSGIVVSEMRQTGYFMAKRPIFPKEIQLSAMEPPSRLSILTIRFAFGSDKFSKRCSALACEADPYVMCDLCDSHITFPGSTVAFLWLRCRLRKTANTPFFSHNFSWHLLSPLLGRPHFSHINFVDVVKNVVLRG